MNCEILSYHAYYFSSTPPLHRNVLQNNPLYLEVVKAANLDHEEVLKFHRYGSMYKSPKFRKEERVT